tara:strand:+ start:501 stop:740 length:240 start_codon:yes stop_codon:yes gene_type:complete
MQHLSAYAANARVSGTRTNCHAARTWLGGHCIGASVRLGGSLMTGKQVTARSFMSIETIGDDITQGRSRQEAKMREITI